MILTSDYDHQVLLALGRSLGVTAMCVSDVEGGVEVTPDFDVSGYPAAAAALADAALASSNRAAAQSLLEKTDLVALRCVKAGVAFPANWLAYVNALRAVLDTGTVPSDGMPPQPAYPAGT